MNLNNVPSKSEVMGWNPQTLADYMKRLNLPGCDKVVMKGSISGAQFIHMTECDLQAFPSVYIPIITKIHSEVSKREQRRFFGNKYANRAVFAQREENWDSDESDNDSDNVYEGPDEEEGEDNYICALTEPPTAEEQDSDESSESDFELPSSPHTSKPPLHPRPATPRKCQSRDPVRYPTPAERTSKPLLPPLPRTNHSAQPPLRAPAGQPSPHIDRSSKPGQSSPLLKDLPKSKGSAVKAPGSSSSKYRPPKAPKPTDVFIKATKLTPAPPVPTQRTIISHSKPGPREDLDPSWYGGKVTRRQAEAILREVNKDGTFVVRDSTKGSAEHPYTLMLLKDDKVYNIKIRYQGNAYSLGTGLKNSKIFPGVTEMITHHTLNPLLLIDATDPSSEAHNQSCLLYPAGL
ncbi:lymphocyte cytosolic protein 2 [Thunnus thynnus]|uniref:lymphocyte cytosolic protein 2 n=1 Tax=Thunnus thynnus TaxID=8237 RepID=UPI0035280241